MVDCCRADWQSYRSEANERAVPIDGACLDASAAASPGGCNPVVTWKQHRTWGCHDRVIVCGRGVALAFVCRIV
jgi:hypothetical protein